jgi:hypothetical protein
MGTKIVFTAALRNLAGTDDLFETVMDEQTNPPVQKRVVLTVKEVCTRALIAQSPNEETEAKEKLARYNLAKAIQDSGEEGLELKSDDIVLLKNLVGRMWPTIVVGQVFNIID